MAFLSFKLGLYFDEYIDIGLTTDMVVKHDEIRDVVFVNDIILFILIQFWPL